MDYQVSPAAPQAGRQDPEKPGGAPKPGVSRGLFVAVTVLSACTFLGLMAFGVMMAAIAFSTGSASMQAQERVKELESRVVYLEDETTRFWIASDIFQYGVTDSFFTNNVLFCDGNVVLMDIGVQRDFDGQYEGEGKFRVSDTDLTAEIYEMMLEFKHSYDNAKSKTMADFSALEVQISVYGYDLATFQDDEVTLVNGR